MAGKGPYISAILYEAKDIERAFADGEWAGMEAIAAPAEDPLTGLKTAKLREPSGNLVELREAASS